MKITLIAEENQDKAPAPNVIDLRAIIIGFRIIWDMRHRGSWVARKEKRDYLKESIEYLKAIKQDYGEVYERALTIPYRECVC